MTSSTERVASRIGIFLCGFVVFAVIATVGLLLSRIGGVFSIIGWIIIVFAVLGALGSFSVFGENQPGPSLVHAAEGLTASDLDRLHADASSPVVAGRVVKAEELSDFLAVNAIRMGDDDNMQNAFRAGMISSGATWLPHIPLRTLMRLMIGRLLISEARSSRSISLQDAAFVHLLCSDFAQALGPEIDISTPVWAWEALSNGGFFGGFFADLPIPLAEVIAMIEEAQPYNLAAGDDTMTVKSALAARQLVAEFREPW